MKFTITAFVALAAVASAAPQAQRKAPGPAPQDNGPQMFSEIEIKAPCGQCLSSSQGGRVKLAVCDKSGQQKWNIVTGVGSEAKDSFIINSQTNECLNFQRRKGAGKSVTLVSCGGAEAKGVFPAGDRNQFPLKGEEVTLEPVAAKNQCVQVNGNALDKSRCDGQNDNQLFTMNV